jgi:hypothetical protein
VTPASVFRFMWISLHHNVVKRVGSSTERFRSVFCSTDGPLNVILYCAYGSAYIFSHLNYRNLCCILAY